MPSAEPSAPSRVVILGTGGTIAGTAADAADHLGYRSAQLGVQALVAAVPPLAGRALECEQIAQLDSKDMDHATWHRLAQRAGFHLAREDVAGVVVTHGTDTLEESAIFLQRVLAPAKPLVLTAAMRPATALSADGPQNLLDAVTLASRPEAAGVLAVLAGRVWSGAEVRKVHSWHTDAFGAGDAGPLATVVDGRPAWLRVMPRTEPMWPEAADLPPPPWPVVEIVSSHAGARAETVDALVAAGAEGLVVAATGNGSVHQALDGALRRARERGVEVLVATRCAAGGVVPTAHAHWSGAGGATPAQARVELMLRLLARRVQPR